MRGLIKYSREVVCIHQYSKQQQNNNSSVFLSTIFNQLAYVFSQDCFISVFVMAVAGRIALEGVHSQRLLYPVIYLKLCRMSNQFCVDTSYGKLEEQYCTYSDDHLWSRIKSADPKSQPNCSQQLLQLKANDTYENSFCCIHKKSLVFNSLKAKCTGMILKQISSQSLCHKCFFNQAEIPIHSS